MALYINLNLNNIKTKNYVDTLLPNLPILKYNYLRIEILALDNNIILRLNKVNIFIWKYWCSKSWTIRQIFICQTNI